MTISKYITSFLFLLNASNKGYSFRGASLSCSHKGTFLTNLGCTSQRFCLQVLKGQSVTNGTIGNTDAAYQVYEMKQLQTYCPLELTKCGGCPKP